MPHPHPARLIVSRRTRRYSFRTTGAEQTHRLGVEWGRLLHGGEIIALEGPLGAGKTVLAAGLCKGLGVEDVVLSPTFVLQEEFHGRVDVVHADLYRLEYESEVEELALWEQAESGNTLIVEWADRYLPIYDAADAAIRLRPAEGDVRAIEVECTPALGSVFESGKS